MDTATMVSTRLAMRTLAEHLLAGDLWRRTGRIGLHRTPGGFGQPESLFDGTRHRLRIDGARLVVLDVDEPFAVDAAAASILEDWFELVDVALAEVRRRHSDLAPTIAQLWPEHFDLAFSMSQISVGGSPGDAARDEPYLYVGPWSPSEGPASNEPWGMSLGLSGPGRRSRLL